MAPGKIAFLVSRDPLKLGPGPEPLCGGRDTQLGEVGSDAGVFHLPSLGPWLPPPWGGRSQGRTPLENIQKSCISWQIQTMLPLWLGSLNAVPLLGLHMEGDPGQNEETKPARLASVTSASQNGAPWPSSPTYLDWWEVDEELQPPC